MQEQDVVLSGKGINHPPLTGKQWDAINEAAALLRKAGLSTLITGFYADHRLDPGTKVGISIKKE